MYSNSNENDVNQKDIKLHKYNFLKDVKYTSKMQLQEKFMKKYIDNYKFTRPEDEKYADELTKLTNVKFVSFNEFNKEKPKEKQKIQTRETNKHIFLKYIRAISENLNIIENVSVINKDEKEDFITTNRPILDINGTRIIRSGYPTYLIKCNVEATDYDRIRHVDAVLADVKMKYKDTISKYKIDRLKEMFLIDNDKMDIDQFQRDIDRATQDENKELNKWFNNLVKTYDGDLLKVIKENTPEEEEEEEKEEEKEFDMEKFMEYHKQANIKRNEKLNKNQGFFFQSDLISNSSGSQSFKYNPLKEDLKNKNVKVKELLNDKDKLAEFKFEESEKIYFDKNTLINLTDIIYYLNEEELYETAKYFNDGTLFVGTCHIPKKLNLNQHMLQFNDKIEGYTQISVNNKSEKDNTYINIDKAIFTMKTFGNDHIYKHKLSYLKWINPDTSLIIPQPNNNKIYDYILKAIPLDNYDCNATFYTRFKILKITKPHIDDYLSEKDMTYETFELVQKLEKCITIKERINIVRDNNYQEPQVHNTLKNNKYIQQLVEKLKTQKQIKDTRTQMEKELDQKCNVIEGKYYLAQTSKRNWYGVRTMTKIAIDPVTTMCNVQGIKDEIIERARIKLIQMQEFNNETVKSFLSWFNKELPTLKIIDELIPLTARLIKETMDCELKIKSMVNSKLVKLLNDVKNEKMKLIYQSENIMCKIYRYLRNAFTFTEEKEFDLNITKLDF
jgi:uncharacterized protein YlbG (UPF0298 family)